MIRANFFIIGAPKCGTSAISEYLRDHPNVFMTYPKEPGYFADDFPGLRFAKSAEEYGLLYSRADSGRHLAIGEASTFYLMSKSAVKNIHSYNPDSRLIVILRNPLEMLPSYHLQLQFSMFEDEADFSQAWELQSERREGRRIPGKCKDPGLLQYGNLARFGEQLRRVYDSFPKEQVLVLFFDDFRRSPKEVYRKVIAFLNLPDDGREHFPVVNPAKRARFPFLNRLLRAPPEPLMNLVRRLSGTPLLAPLIRLHGHIVKRNVVRVSSAPLSEEMRKKIVASYADDIRELESLVGRDLSAWRTVLAPGDEKEER